MCKDVHMNVGSLGDWKKVSDSLELELQVVVSCVTWVLGPKLGSPARAVHVLHCCAFSAATKTPGFVCAVH